MRILIWAGTFLLLAVIGSTVAAAAMIGMPIAGEVQFGVFAMATLLVGWGVVLLATSTRLAAAKARTAAMSNDTRCFPQGDKACLA